MAVDSQTSPLGPSQALAQRSMAIMNKLGARVMTRPTDQPGQSSWRVLAPTEPLSLYAEHVIEGDLELTMPAHNNVLGLCFVELPVYGRR